MHYQNEIRLRFSKARNHFRAVFTSLMKKTYITKMSSNGICGFQLGTISVLILAWLLITPFAALASKPDADWYKVPAGYVKGKGSLKISKNAPCNMGKESFSDFLDKFNKNAQFRSERSQTSETHEVQIQYDGLLKIYADALEETGLIPIHGHLVRNNNVTDYEIYSEAGIFYDVDKDMVKYNCWKDIDPEGYSSFGAVILFERIDGRWYMTDIYSVGQLNYVVLKHIEALE